MNKSRPHIAILEEEMASLFRDSHLKVYVDGTVGAGGHARRILEEHPEIELFVGFDQDPEALAIARDNLKDWSHKVELVHANFEELGAVLKSKGVTSVDGFFLTSGFRQCNWIKTAKGLVF